MKEEILRLRAEGKSYRVIQKELGCSRGAIAYHCNDTTKEKQSQSNKKSRVKRSARNRLASKVRGFRIDCRDNALEGSITVAEVYDKYGETSICYLTGRPINLENDDYHLDHIIPCSKGGSCSIDNLGITHPQANYAKSNGTVEELIILCRDILTYNGYEVSL